MAPGCIAMRTLTSVDVQAFSALCELEVVRRAASAVKDSEDFALIKDGVVNPAIRLERDTASALRPYFEKFGMEPSGRARIKVPKTEPVSKWAGLGIG